MVVNRSRVVEDMRRRKPALRHLARRILRIETIHGERAEDAGAIQRIEQNTLNVNGLVARPS